MDRRLGRPLPHQLPNPTRADPPPINLSPKGRIRHYPQFPEAIPEKRARSHALLTRPPLILLCARLACVRPAASVRSEPGSNSQVETAKAVSLTSNLRTSVSSIAEQDQSLSMCSSCRSNKNPQDSEADTYIIEAHTPSRPICKQSNAETPKPPTYPFIILQSQRA